MGNQPAACQTAAATPADPSINICPAGWRLPTGGANNNQNEFWNLNQAIGGSGAQGSDNLRNNGLFMYSGFFRDGGFVNVGTDGRYWSSTVGNATDAHNLLFSASNVFPANNNSKGSGLAVRCVAE